MSFGPARAKDAKKEQYFLAAFAAFAFQCGVSEARPRAHGTVNALNTYVNPAVRPMLGSIVVKPKKTAPSSRTGPRVNRPPSFKIPRLSVPGNAPPERVETRPFTSPTSSVCCVVARANDAPYPPTSFCRLPCVGSDRIAAPTLTTTRMDWTVFAPSNEP
jgi:hypothetical protein